MLICIYTCTEDNKDLISASLQLNVINQDSDKLIGELHEKINYYFKYRYVELIFF
jgi:hypothetical protein